MRRSRSQSRPSLTVTASSQTAQRASLDAYSWPVFVAGEPLMVTVKDYVVDLASGIPMHFSIVVKGLTLRMCTFESGVSIRRQVRDAA